MTGYPPPLIGLIGKKRSGKDSLAVGLIAIGYQRVAFADPLKAVARDLDPFVGLKWRTAAPPTRLSELLGNEGWEAAKERAEVRRLLQALGVAVRDHIGPDVWVDAAFREVKRQRWADHCGGACEQCRPRPVVITDVRFPNEAERIKQEHGYLWRIVRPGLDSTDQHVSETALDDWPVDRTIINDGTIADLHAKIGQEC